MPETGSLQAFDEKSEPVTAAYVPLAGEQRQRQAAREGVLAFQHEWGRYGEIVPEEHHDLVVRGRPLLETTLLRFVVEPTADEARTFGAWVHDVNFGSDEAEPVLRDELAERLPYMTPVQLLELPGDRLYWPFGLAALHHPSLARAAAAIAFGELPADLFTGAIEGYAALYIDYGVGLLPRAQIPVRANSRGLSYVCRRVAASPLQAVALRFPPGLVRVDWMRLRFGFSGGEPTIVDLRWPQDAERVRYRDADVLLGNVLFGQRRAPLIAFECPDEWKGTACYVEVEAGFAWLPGAPGAPRARDRATVALALARRAYPRALKVVQLGRSVSRRVVR
jgi:hypothetical protein